MTRRLAWSSVIGTVAMIGTLAAQTAGTATGNGTIDNQGTPVKFAPHLASAYMQNFQALRFTWIVMTEKPVPAGLLAGTADHTEALRRWCEKEKTPFAALQLDAKGGVNQYVTCPANGGMNSEMLSTINGVESIAPKIDARDATHIKGSLKTGNGACPGPGNKLVYCTATGDYTFDAVFVQAGIGSPLAAHRRASETMRVQGGNRCRCRELKARDANPMSATGTNERTK